MQQGDKRSWMPREEAWTRDLPLNYSKLLLYEKDCGSHWKQRIKNLVQKPALLILEVKKMYQSLNACNFLNNCLIFNP